MKEQIEDLKKEIIKLKKELSLINIQIAKTKNHEHLQDLKEQKEMVKIDIYDVQCDIEYLERNLEQDNFKIDDNEN